MGMAKASDQSLKKAMALKDRASELEKFYITGHYFSQIGDLDKCIEIYEQWHKAYPRDSIPINNLGLAYASLGEMDKALQMALEETKVDPDSSYSYQDLMDSYLSANRIDEAKAVAQQALDRKLDAIGVHRDLFVIAFLRKDSAETDRQLAWG